MQHPLRIGLSMEAQVDIRKTDGRMLSDGSAAPTRVHTSVFAHDDSAADAEVRRVIAANGGGGAPQRPANAAAPGSGAAAAGAANTLHAAASGAAPLK